MGTKFLFQKKKRKRKNRKPEGTNTLSKVSVYKIIVKPQQFYYTLITKILGGK